jgi:hypothetical protein
MRREETIDAKRLSSRVRRLTWAKAKEETFKTRNQGPSLRVRLGRAAPAMAELSSQPTQLLRHGRGWDTSAAMSFVPAVRPASPRAATGEGERERALGRAQRLCRACSWRTSDPSSQPIVRRFACSPDTWRH